MPLDLRRRVDVLAARNRPFGYVMRIVRRWSTANGTTAANSIALYGFLGLFAVTLLAVALIGILDAQHRSMTQEITDYLGLSGGAAKVVERAVDTARRSRRFATIVGVAGIVVIGTSFANAIATAYNLAWGVRNRPLLAQRVRDFVWILGFSALMGVGLGLTVWWTRMGEVVAPFALLIALGTNAAIWVLTAWWLPNRTTSWRVMLPGIVVGAVGLEAMKIVGGVVVPRLIEHASQLWGTIGIVFGLLTWMLVFSRIVVVVTLVEAEAGEHHRPPIDLPPGTPTP